MLLCFIFTSTSEVRELVLEYIHAVVIDIASLVRLELLSLLIAVTFIVSVPAIWSERERGTPENGERDRGAPESAERGDFAHAGIYMLVR